MSAFILNPFGTSLCCFVCAMCVRMYLFCLTLKVGNLWPAGNCQLFKGCPSLFIIEGKLLFSSVISDTAAIEILFRLNICSNLFRDTCLLGMMLPVRRYCIQASFVSYREWKWRNTKNWRHQLSPHRFQCQLQLKTKSILLSLLFCLYCYYCHLGRICLHFVPAVCSCWCAAQWLINVKCVNR